MAGRIPVYVLLCQYFEGKYFNRAFLNANTAGIAKVVVYHNPAFVYGNGSGVMGTAPRAGATPGADFLLPWQFISLLFCH